MAETLTALPPPHAQNPGAGLGVSAYAGRTPPHSFEAEEHLLELFLLFLEL